MVEAQTVTADSNHAGVQNLRGWSLTGTFVANLRRETVSGQILATVTNTSHELFCDSINAEGGTYVQVTSGSITSGILYYY